MKPRIFVSSTFYDLKYIREDLSNFIKAHDFEPIMFEDGDIGYIPGKDLDKSCYKAMRSADMVLLIIGGNYGSPATGEDSAGFKEYISVTRNEFKEAVKGGIPVYAFIDSKVYAEFEVYEVNFDKIENKNEIISFRNTKDINVFRFIREIKEIGHISITGFEKSFQIKDFLSKQWSDMFKHYLDYLKEKRSDEKLGNTIDEMKVLIKKMDIMLDTVGKKILINDNDEAYNEVMKKQNIITVCEKIVNNFKLYGYEDTEVKRSELISNFLNVLYDSLNEKIWTEVKTSDYDSMKRFYMYFNSKDVPLYEAEFTFYESANDFKDIMKDAIERDILIKELIKSEYYEQIIYKVSVNKFKELKEIKL